MTRKYPVPSIKDATLAQGVLFQLLMQNKEVCKEFLWRTVPEANVVEIEDITLEKVLGVHYTYHGSRLDIHVRDNKGQQFDIELQITDEKNSLERSWYYHGLMITSSIERGQDYSKLKPTYVIFICTFDPVGLKRPVYRFGAVNLDHRDEDMPFSPKTIFYNTKGDLSLLKEHDIKGLLQMINNDTPEKDDFVKLVQEEVNELKGDKEARKIYMDRWEETLREAVKIEVAEQVKEKVDKQVKEKVAEQVKEKVDKQVKEKVAELTAKQTEEKQDGIRNLITSLVAQGQNSDSILSLVMSAFKLNHQEAEEAYHKYGSQQLA